MTQAHVPRILYNSFINEGTGRMFKTGAEENPKSRHTASARLNGFTIQAAPASAPEVEVGASTAPQLD